MGSRQRGHFIALAHPFAEEKIVWNLEESMFEYIFI